MTDDSSDQASMMVTHETGRTGIRRRRFSGAFPRSLAAIAAALGFTVVFQAVAPLLLIGLSVWSFRGYRQVVQSLTIAWLVTSLNPALYQGPEALRWLVIVSAVLSVVYRNGPRRTLRTVRTSGLGIAVLLIVPSILFSSSFELALFKLAGFALGAFVIVAVFMSRPLIDRQWLSHWFVALFWVVLIPSLPLIMSEVGFLRNGSGFQGILNQPQTLGVFLAPYTAVFVLSWLTKDSIPFSGLGAIAAIVVLPLTEARVGAVAAILGVAIAVLASRVQHRRVCSFERRRAVLASVGLVFVVFLTFVLGYGDAIQDFATKSRSASLVESFEISRGEVVRESIGSFMDSPIVGRGLGVPAEIDEAQITTFAGFPVGAPVEAGFALTGLLEQGGVLGLAGMLVLLVKTVWPTIRRGTMAAAGLAAAALLTNLGEATITSFGGLGLFVWLLMGWAVVIARNPSEESRGSG